MLDGKERSVDYSILKDPLLEKNVDLNPVVSPIPETLAKEEKISEPTVAEKEQPVSIIEAMARDDAVYSLALACFLRFAGPFFAYVIQSTNNYHHQCMRDGVTPVRRLQIAREKRKREIPLLPELLVNKESAAPSIPLLLVMDSGVQMNDKDHSTESSQFDLTSSSQQAAVPSSLPEVPVDEGISRVNVPMDLNMFEPISDHSSASTMSKRTHSKKWKDIFPMEFLQYVSSILSYPSSFADSYSVSAFHGDANDAYFTVTLSRDRKAQIKRTVCFPELTSIMEVVNTYQSKLPQEESAFASLPEESIDAKQVISAYLQSTMAMEDPMQTLAALRSMRISLNEDQNLMLSSLRSTERQEDVVLCFITELLLNTGYELYCQQQKLSHESFTQFEYGCLLKAGIQWLNSVPASSVFDADVHFLVQGRRTKSGVLRRHCYMCSPRGSKTHKRTQFICLQCHLPFCLSSSCFELYHQKNGFKYYRDEVFRPN